MRRWTLILAGALAVAPAARAQPASEPAPLRGVACSFPTMVEDLRAALKGGSPAYRRYLKELFKRAARSLPTEELRAAFDREQEPEVLEALGLALAARSSFLEDPSAIAPLLERASRDANPNLRAAAVRGLREIGAVDTMAKLGGVRYEQLVRDSAPEVREAVAGNLIRENAEVYHGHYRPAAEMAVASAAASPDPLVAAKLLGEVSLEQIGPESVQQVAQQLRSENATLRAAAAKALGGVPASEAAGARKLLADLYREERDANVRKAILQGIVQLGMYGARPTLESLRGVEPSLTPEIDAWMGALKLGLQEWHLVLREKQRLRR